MSRRPKLSSVLSLSAIAMVFVFGATYLTFGVVRVSWFKEYTQATMVLGNSGGLLPRSPILLSGIEVGEVTAVSNTAQGVEVAFRIDDTYRIPANSPVVIANISALGEPYVLFTPSGQGAPFIEDGSVVHAAASPLSIPEMARAVTDLLNQLDPAVIGELIDTFAKGLAGTESIVPQLARSTDLLASTLLSRSKDLRSMLIDLQSIVTDTDWLGPSLAAGGPLFGEFGVKVGKVADAIKEVSHQRDTPTAYTTGNGLIPFLHGLTDRLECIGPDLQRLVPVLQPLVSGAAEWDTIDLSALIAQALGSVGNDGAIHLQINVK